MSLSKKINDQKVIRKNKKLDKANLLELYQNVLTINEKMETTSRLVLDKSNALVSQDAFHTITDDINLRISELEASAHVDLENSWLEHFKGVLDSVNSQFVEFNKTTIAKIQEKLIRADQDKEELSLSVSALKSNLQESEKRFGELNAMVAPCIQEYALLQQIKEEFVQLQQQFVQIEDEYLRLKELESTYRETANSLVEDRIVTSNLAQKTAVAASKLILDAFNAELSKKDAESGKTIAEAMLGIMRRYNLIAESQKEVLKKPPQKTEEMKEKHKTFSKVLECVKAGVIPMVVGPAGSGKSVAMIQLAEELQLPFYMANRIQNTFELVGFVNAAGKYVSTQFYEAFKKGGLFFFDEVDASSPEALVTINAAIAQGKMAFPGHAHPVEQHPDFKVVVAGNTAGRGSTMQYTGRNKLDAATLDRFLLIHWDYDEELEKKIIGDADLLEICQIMRRATIKSEKVIISTRGIKALDELFSHQPNLSDEERGELINDKFFDALNREELSSILVGTFQTLTPSNKYYNALLTLGK